MCGSLIQFGNLWDKKNGGNLESKTIKNFKNANIASGTGPICPPD
jgi:hypothetical protein